MSSSIKFTAQDCSHKGKRAFTLAELLVVIAIIMMIAGLILAGSNWLRERTRILMTEQRMNQVLVGLNQYSTDADLAAKLQRVAGFELELVTLRSIMTYLRDDQGLDFVETATRGSYPVPAAGTPWIYPDDGHLPPQIAIRWENGKHRNHSRRESRPLWPNQETHLDAIVTFMERQITRSPSASTDNRGLDIWRNLGYWVSMPNNYWMLVIFDDATPGAFGGHYGTPAVRERGQIVHHSRGVESVLGESLDGTVEVKPDGIRSARWYAEQWPNLEEYDHIDPSGQLVFVQKAWPQSDWHESDPGDTPVVWHWPWGRQIFSRLEGTVLSQTEYELGDDGYLRDRTLADLSPLATIRLLQASGVLPAGSDGAELLRNDRSPNQPWNDAWGSPLVVANASFMPARYDIDDVNNLQMHGGAEAYVPRESREMHGGRDYFLNKAQEVYQFRRAFYATVGCIGLSYDHVVPEDWGEGDDAVVLRDLWLEILENTRGGEWTGESFSNPPWSGIRNVSTNGTRSMITTPNEIR